MTDESFIPTRVFWADGTTRVVWTAQDWAELPPDYAETPNGPFPTATVVPEVLDAFVGVPLKPSRKKRGAVPQE